MSGPGGKRRRVEEEDLGAHENEERWLLTYSDMITLLMVLFIVMFAMSQVDQKKYMALKTGLSAGFGAPVAMLHGADRMLDPGGAIAPDSVNLSGDVSSERVVPALEPTPKVETKDVARVAELASATSRAQVEREYLELEKVRKRLVASLRKAGIPKSATFRYDERGLVVTIATDEVLFANASAELRGSGRRILDTLAPTLREIPNAISVDGHTNSLPISTERYPSNWELSADRATGVLRYLSTARGIPVSRLSAGAFADTEPLRSHSDPRAVVLNRRVEIVVIAPLDASSGRALAQLGADVTKEAIKAMDEVAVPVTSPTAPQRTQGTQGTQRGEPATGTAGTAGTAEAGHTTGPRTTADVYAQTHGPPG